MQAFVTRAAPASVAQASVHASHTPSALQLLPNEVFAIVSKWLLGPLDEMYTPYGCARAIASLGQTNHHFRTSMQQLWPVRGADPCMLQRLVPASHVRCVQELVQLLKERRMDAYKALVPEIRWEANPTKPQDLLRARKVSSGQGRQSAAVHMCNTMMHHTLSAALLAL